ncbi:insertion element IS1016 transposase [Neisseria elongata]|uniref:Insertion element IS1016 transposase n=1 Tax=Neisseria elongata TaxID=495 RepID=A0A378TW37_NEIEL|nr:transposase [Neisseria elongata subsp. elongata]STZ67188.1 insertion element IS1016 transposase [Neisseria elongata]
MPDGIVCTDSLSSYGKPDVSGFIHHLINHSKEFADRQNHINGIKNFWHQAKRVYANTTESIANPSRCS